MGLAEFVRVLAGRWVVILAAGVLAAGAAFVVGGSATPTYSASAEALVREGVSETVTKILPTLMRNVDRDWNTRVLGLKSEALAATVIEEQGYDLKPAALASRVQIVTDPTNGLVKVSVSDADPQMAADLTNAVIGQYALNARATQEQSLDEALASAEERLAAARKRISVIPGTPGATSDPGVVGLASHESAAALVDTLRLGADTQVDPVVVTLAAVAPAPAGDSGTLKTVLFGLFAGLALGVILALLFEYLARTGPKEASAS
ncbi:MAG: hypothetical protein KJ747_05845 [Actinobacteria bacterium]|nr:hypothetical protein [Actinomycetota bacterium]MCG2807400.1 hypothetical protein [Coriobacteriia bacterium]